MRNRPEVPPSILRLYNIYGRPQQEIRLRPEQSPQGSQQSDTQFANADNNQESLADNPNSEPQTPASPQHNQGNQEVPPGPAPQLNFGPGPFPQHFQNGFNFGVPPGQFNFGYSPPNFNQNPNGQQPSNGGQAQNLYAQNFPPFNFRTGTHLTNQVNSAQNGNTASNTQGQTNGGLYTGANASPLPIPTGQQQIQNYNQFGGFPFNAANFPQNFQQQFAAPNFGTGGFSNISGQLSTGAQSDDPQRSIVGFYGGGPNIGGYSFNTPGLQTQQQQQAISGPGGFFGAGFGQYTNSVPQLSNLGVDQIGNNFARFAYNPSAFQTGGLAPQGGFNSNFSIERSSPGSAAQAQ